jgi:hypothetical protein
MFFSSYLSDGKKYKHINITLVMMYIVSGAHQEVSGDSAVSVLRK